MLQLTLLSRGYCHLCDLMRDAVLAHPASDRIALDIVEVDDDPVLVERFDEQVPVLMAAGEVICWGRFDPASFAAYVERNASAS